MENELVNYEDIESLSKADIMKAGQEFAKALRAAGFSYGYEVLIQARKANEFLTAVIKETESQVIEEVELNNGTVERWGAKLEVSSTGDRLNYKEDPVWLDLNNALKIRQDLLKLARKSKDDIFDGDGAQVPKVSLASASRSVLRVKL